ncbi:MAG: hypothetical protein AB7V46_07840 [Thermomicrobiales bacterium]
MALGFPAYHEERVRYDGIDDRDLMKAISKALDRVGWNWSRTDRYRFRAGTGFQLFSYGETVTVEMLGEGRLFVRSEYVVPFAWLDWGLNSQNVRKLLRSLDDVLDADVME